MSKRAPRRRTSFLAPLVAAGLVLSACSGGGEDEGDPEADGADASASAEPTPEESETPYLPVPETVDLTERGSELTFGDSAAVAWEPNQNLVGALDIEIIRVERTGFAKSFKGWKIDNQTKKKTPYFIRAWIENIGDTDVGGTDVPLYIVDTDNTLIQPSRFQSRFGPCPSNPVFSKEFAPGKREKFCMVYLAPEGTELDAVSFRPSQEFDPITWSGDVKDIRDPKPADKKKNKKNQGDQNGDNDEA